MRDSPVEVNQTMRDVGVLGQESLASPLGLVEFRRLAGELLSGRPELVGVRLAIQLPGLLGAVEAIRCVVQMTASFVPSPGSKTPRFEVPRGTLVPCCRLVKATGSRSGGRGSPTATAGVQVGGVVLDGPQLATGLVDLGRTVRRD